MPAVSKKQQKFFGIVRAVQKGEMAPTTPETAKAAADMKKSDVKKFASTKHKGLPEKKKVEEMNNPTNNVQDKKQQSPQDKKMNQMMIKVLMKKIQALRSGSTTTISASNHLDGEVIEAANPAQQAAIAISMKKKGQKPKNFKEQLTYKHFVNKAKESSARVEKNKERQREMNAMAAYKDKKGKGIKFYDKKGSGRMKDGKKVYD